MKRILPAFLFFALLIISAEAQAQDRLSVALKLGYGTGAYEATYSGAGAGKVAFRVDVNYFLFPVLDAYIAYAHTDFECKEGDGFCNSAPVNFTSSGFSLGLKLDRGRLSSMWIPWLKAGLVHKRLKWTQDKQSYSDPGLGFEIGAGFTFPVTKHINVVPAINYTRYSIAGATGIKQGVVVLTALIGARYEF